MVQLFRWEIRNSRETKRTLAFVNVVLVMSKIQTHLEVFRRN